MIKSKSIFMTTLKSTLAKYNYELFVYKNNLLPLTNHQMAADYRTLTV
ncbi:MAG TPA: hypothetical protein IAC96_03535 [Candidatus Fimimorpha faecalis]|uniref:Uncharacterized protein n=1 Tax=Candidatus Fimimorpha faecalis TaxID=2840824 RepID=A0A9D1JCC0_9FIRM|nr:hypothetical protein [Candidatus Fimimorpha faecalis]